MKLFLWKIYAYKFFDDLILIYPFYVIMFGNFGQTPLQIGILLGVWSLTVLLLEVPSGIFADKYDRRTILFGAQVLRGIGYLVWMLYPTFLGFLIGFILWGAKSAFTSGTFQALVFDELKSFGKEKQYIKIIGRGRSLAHLAMLLSAVLASLAIRYDYSFVIQMSLVALALSSLSIILVKPVRMTQSVKKREYFKILKQGISEVRHSSTIMRLILFMAVLGGLGGALDEYWPIFASHTTLSLAMIAIFLGIDSGAQAVATFYAHKFEHVSNFFLYFSFFVVSLGLGVAAYFTNVPSLTLLIIHSMVYVVLANVFEGKLQHATKSDVRATVLSMSGFSIEVFVLLVYFGFGAVSNIIGYQYGFYVFAVIGVLFTTIYLTTRVGKFGRV